MQCHLPPSVSSAMAMAALALLFSLNAAAATGSNNYSTWMAASIMSRRQGVVSGDPGAALLLQAGIVQQALVGVAELYGDRDVMAYVESSVVSVVPWILNASADIEYPLDRLSNGRTMLRLLNSTANVSCASASGATSLRASIDRQPRNQNSGLWYYTYPYWSYLDGMYSLAPFYAATSLRDHNTSALADMQLQFDLLWNATRNATTGLLVHGYDASKTAVWADPVTGASPHVWVRSLGWLAMALVDTLEILPTQSAPFARLVAYWRSLANALLVSVDPATGGWWQVMDRPGAELNYIESSGSSMFAYSLLKAARIGLLEDSQATWARAVGQRATRFLSDTFVDVFPDGTLGWNGTVAVCSLNSTANYMYYVHQPLSYNSVLGAGPFILASLEAERLSETHG